jgi:hypothetical protein
MPSEEPVVANHASPRNDKEAFEYPLQRPVSLRTAKHWRPTFQAQQRFHGHSTFAWRNRW